MRAWPPPNASSPALSHDVFVLTGLDELGALKPLLFLPLLLLLCEAAAANALLLGLVARRPGLQAPMYLLMGAMAAVDLGLPLLLGPHLLLNFLFGLRHVRLAGCLLQMFLLHLLGAFQSTLLLAMALDRYFAVCAPLQYHRRMAPRNFLRLLLPLLARNLLLVALVALLAGRQRYCGSDAVAHLFCEHMALVELACGGGAALSSALGLVAVGLIAVADFLGILVSYALILGSVLRSGTWGAKALHTCVSHLLVLCVSLTAVLTAFLSYRLRTHLPPAARVLFSLAYVFLPSCINPVIYGVRTAQIRRHIRDLLLGKT